MITQRRFARLLANGQPRPRLDPGGSHLRTQLRVIGFEFGWRFGVANDHGIDSRSNHTEQNAGEHEAHNQTNAVQVEMTSDTS